VQEYVEQANKIKLADNAAAKVISGTKVSQRPAHCAKSAKNSKHINGV
jgi:hypothetical protein